MKKLINVRITPLLKALGFKSSGRSSYIYRKMDIILYECRIYKCGNKERYVEIIKTHYDECGYLDYRSLICKNLCLDVPIEQLGSIIIWISYIAKEIGNFESVMRSMNYWLGLGTEKYNINHIIEKKDVL